MYLSVNTVITVPSADPPDDDGDGKKRTAIRRLGE